MRMTEEQQELTDKNGVKLLPRRVSELGMCPILRTALLPTCNQLRKVVGKGTAEEKKEKHHH